MYLPPGGAFGSIGILYIPGTQMNPNESLFLKVNHSKQALNSNQKKGGPFRFQVYID